MFFLSSCLTLHSSSSDHPSVHPITVTKQNWLVSRRLLIQNPHSTLQIASILGSAVRADTFTVSTAASGASTNVPWYTDRLAVRRGMFEIHRHMYYMEMSPFVVVVHKGRHGADLDSVRVVGWIFKQAIVGVEEFSGHQEEKLSGGPTVVQPATQISQLLMKLLIHQKTAGLLGCYQMCV